jgi:multiple antibiotic resistance protein
MDPGELLGFTTALLALVNPIALVGAFLAYTEPYSGEIQRSIAWTTAVSVAIFMLATTWLGGELLEFFGISVPALQVACGLILLLASLQMAAGSLAGANAGCGPLALAASAADDWRVLAVVPLAIPLTVGGGVMALIISFTSIHGELADLLEITSSCLLISLICALVYSSAPIISRFLGPAGLAVLGRISAVLVAAIAAGVLASGLKGLLPGLAG